MSEVNIDAELVREGGASLSLLDTGDRDAFLITFFEEVGGVPNDPFCEMSALKRTSWPFASLDRR